MKSFLTATAILETMTGLALVTAPSFVVAILLGSSLSDASGILLGRLAGAVLIALSAACWLFRNDVRGPVMVKIMAGYNIFTILLLIYAGVVEKLSGIGLWPTVLLHVGLLVWCLTFVWNKGFQKSAGLTGKPY